METITTDVRRIKNLLNSNNEKKVKRLSNTFLPEYNVQILSKLDPFEKTQWLKINGYGIEDKKPAHRNEAHNLADVK